MYKTPEHFSADPNFLFKAEIQRYRDLRFGKTQHWPRLYLIHSCFNFQTLMNSLPKVVGLYFTPFLFCLVLFYSWQASLYFLLTHSIINTYLLRCKMSVSLLKLPHIVSMGTSFQSNIQEMFTDHIQFTSMSTATMGPSSERSKSLTGSKPLLLFQPDRQGWCLKYGLDPPQMLTTRQAKVDRHSPCRVILPYRQQARCTTQAVELLGMRRTVCI